MGAKDNTTIYLDLRNGLTGACFDHLAIIVRSRKVEQALFEYLGLQAGYSRRAIGNTVTSMDTVVMHTPVAESTAAGQLQIAFMSGNDGIDTDGKKILSQISEYFARRGNFFVQHIAIRVQNIHTVVNAWSALGVKFITSDEHGPHILLDQDMGATFLQCFTYPVVEGSGTFLELKQITRPGETPLPTSKQFRDRNVEGLWEHVDRLIKDDIIFKVNIFGEPDLEKSLASRGIPLPA